MKAKYFLRGLGLGITVTAALFAIAMIFYQPAMSESEIRQEAKKLGMVDAAATEEAALSDADQAVIEEVEKTESEVQEKADEAEAKKAAPKNEVIIQSPMGGYITPADIAKKVPKNTEDVYVRVDENKLYYVLENGETGDVDIWE